MFWHSSPDIPFPLGFNGVGFAPSGAYVTPSGARHTNCCCEPADSSGIIDQIKWSIKSTISVQFSRLFYFDYKRRHLEERRWSVVFCVVKIEERVRQAISTARNKTKLKLWGFGFTSASSNYNTAAPYTLYFTTNWCVCLWSTDFHWKGRLLSLEFGNGILLTSLLQLWLGGIMI